MEDDKSTAERDTLMYPLLEDLLKQIPSKFEVVVLASLRAREIMRKQRQGASFEGELDADIVGEQETLKPLSRALMEIAEGKLDREKMYLLEYFESFRRGDESAPVLSLRGDGPGASHTAKASSEDLLSSEDTEPGSQGAPGEQTIEESESDAEK